jgi:hypothetical protein
MWKTLVDRGAGLARPGLGDLMCGAGLHWPRGWEPAYETGWEELLCQRDDCRTRLGRRPLTPADVSLPMGGAGACRRGGA